MFNKKDNAVYYGIDKNIRFENGKYLILNERHLSIGEYVEFERFFEYIFDTEKCNIEKATEYLAKYLVDTFLPESIEEIVISHFNSWKKRQLEREQRINEKKRKILRSFK